MNNIDELKALINANIKRNGRQAITGNVLNGILNAMVDNLGDSIFLATYGTTTLAEIREADAEGMIVFCKNGNDILRLQSVNVNGARFAAIVVYEGKYAICNNNGWSTGTFSVSEVFFATYGATTWDEILLMAQTRIVCCVYQNRMYLLSNPVDISDPVTLVFTNIDGTTLKTLNVTIAGAWSNSSIELQVLIANDLTTNDPTKALSAAQGVALKALIDGLGTVVAGKASQADLNALQQQVNTKASQTDLDATNAEVSQLGQKVDEEIGNAKTISSTDYCGMMVIAANGYPTAAVSGYDGVIIPLYEGVEYTLISSRYSWFTFSSIPVINDSSNVIRQITTTSFVASSSEKYLLFSIKLTDAPATLSRSETGIAKRVSISDEKSTEAKEDVESLVEEFGAEQKDIDVQSSDFCGFFWNGTKFAAASTAFNGFFIKVVKGCRLTSSVRRTFYFCENEPELGGIMVGMVSASSVLTYDIPKNGYLFFNINLSSFTSLTFSLSGVGVVYRVQKLETKATEDDYYHKRVAHFLGYRKMLSNERNPFSWGTFSKGVLTIRNDDLNQSVDLAAKIVSGEYGFPLVLAAILDHANASVNGITDPSEKIGNTCLDICRYVIEHGGEVMEHSSNTFSSSDYFDVNGIKPIFIDQLREWERYGILVRGAAVANAVPSDSLKDELAPYLWYYYDYSDNYGKVAPYSGGPSNTLICDNSTYAQICAFIDSLIANNVWGQLIFHHLNYNNTGLTDAVLRQVLDYVATKVTASTLEVKTFAEIFDA